MKISKIIKFSLFVFLFGVATLNAKSLQEAIRNVDVSGFAWYRYDNGRFTNGSDARKQDGYNIDGGGIPWTQMHRFRVALGTKLDIGDNFKLFGQFLYNLSNEPSYAYGDYIGSADTKHEFWLKQAYLEYDNRDYGFSLILGRQNLGTIWTDDLAGMAAKMIVRPNEQISLVAFVVDSFQDGDDRGDFAAYNSDLNVSTTQANVGSTLTNRLTEHNLYGAAILGDFGPLKAQLWGAHLDKTATLYAVNADFATNFGSHLFRIHANYFGNVIDGTLQHDAKRVMNPYNRRDIFANGNLAHLKFALQVGGIDANLGGIYFGEKNKYTIHTLEEAYGGDEEMYIGSEIFYQKGSWGTIAFGRNTYGYFGAGYTLPADVRLGVKGVYGRTANDADTDTGTRATSAKNGGGRKVEGLAEASWQASRGLGFLIYYSYLHTQEDKGVSLTEDSVSVKNTVRLQARYKF